MKLLTPQAVTDTRAQETAREILRSQEIKKEAERLRKELANAEADFRTTLVKIRTQWATDEEVHSQRVKEMKAEVDLLQAKKMNQLIPIGVIGEATEGRLNKAMAYVKELQERESRVEELKEKLEDKLDEFGQKDQDLKRRTVQVKLQEDGVIRANENNRLRTKQLSEEILKFTTDKQARERVLVEKETALVLQTRSLASKEASLKRTNQALSDLEKRLADERSILDRAWQELRRKQYPHT